MKLPVTSGKPLPKISLSLERLGCPTPAPAAFASSASSSPQMPSRLYPQKEPKDKPGTGENIFVILA